MSTNFPQPRSITRDELYTAIWKEPATTVAGRYGITSTALAKICRKLRVPTPPRGYWARVAVGQRPRRPALPALRDDDAVVHVVAPILRARASLPDDLEPVPPVLEVPDVIAQPHPLVLRYEPRLRRNRKNVWSQTDCLAVDVSPEQLDRALRILHVLFPAIEDAGAVVSVTKPTTTSSGVTPSATTITLDDVRFAFSLSEDLRREEPQELQEAVVRARRLHDSRSYEEWFGARREIDALQQRVRYVPTGHLAIRFDIAEHLPESVPKCVRDTKRWRLEDRLGAVVVQLQVIVRLVHQKRARDAEAARLAAEAARRRELEARAALRERLLCEDFERRYDAFAHVNAMLGFVAAVEARSDPTPGRQAWLEWARGRAAAVLEEALAVERVWDTA